jgi:hypothetical protein
MIATYSRTQWGKVLMVLATVATAMGFAISSAVPATASNITPNTSHPSAVWLLPASFDGSYSASQIQAVVGINQHSMFPQTKIDGIGSIPCGRWAQLDWYSGPWGWLGDTLEWVNGHPEDSSIYINHSWVYGGDCAPVKDPTFTEWVDGTPECGVGTVDSIRFRTDYTYAWNEDTKVWDETATVTVEHRTVDVPVVACPPDMPKKDPTFTEWVDGTPECGSGTVDSIRFRTDYTYAWNEDTKVWDETATDTVEHRTVDVPVVACPPDMPKKDPTFTEWFDPEPECGVGTVDSIRSRTDYTYAWNEDTKVWDETATVTVEHRILEVDVIECTTPPVDVCSNIEGDQVVVPEGYTLIEGECLTDVTLDTSSTPTLTEVTLAATGAGGSSGTAALAVALALGGLGLMLLRRRTAEEF